ncbi:MAG: GNAT family N-acetyltransferase, partial [Sulfolobales archaeon]|nr:GNAT family N-acetyltransferase [Sulfolobales archaeon]
NVYEVNEVYLEVRVSNLDAIRLYERFGFLKMKVLKYYYADGEDAYLMAVKLSS